jgi:hypothetical protein
MRDRTHWNIANIQPIDPVALGLCRQLELDAAVAKAAVKATKEGKTISDEERLKLVSTEQSLQMDAETTLPSNMAGLESFTLANAPEDKNEEPLVDADSLFNLPKNADSNEN